MFDGEGMVNRLTLAAPSQNVVTAHIQGRASHAGVEPEKGISALLIAAKILTQLPLGRIDEETTANIGRLEAGLKRNIIPETAFLDGEIRSRDRGKLDRYSQQFREVFNRVAVEYREARVSLDIRNSYQAYHLESSDRSVEMIAKALEKVGLEPSLEASGGGSDANVFIENGIRALPVGIGVHSFHTKDETAVISEVLKGAEVCEQIITGL